MKRMISVLSIFLFLISAAGCQRLSGPSGKATPSDEYMDVGVTHGISYPNPEVAELIYTGEMIELKYLMRNREGKQKWSLQIFINGIQQPFYINDSKIETIQYCSVFEAHQEKTFQVGFRPLFGNKGDVLTAHFIVMLNPEYIITSPREDSSYLAYHTITQIVPWRVCIDDDTGKNPPKFTKENSALTSAAEYDGASDAAFNLYKDNKLINLIKAQKNTPLEVSIGVSGLNEQFKNKTRYRLSVYINHEICKLNGAYYTDIDIVDAKEKLLLFKGIINTATLKKPDNHIYIIAVPLSDDTENLPTVIKSRSIPLVYN